MRESFYSKTPFMAKCRGLGKVLFTFSVKKPTLSTCNYDTVPSDVV